METVNVHDAKTRLSELLAKVERGEEIVIARNGRPVARLVAANVDPRRRTPGLDKGQVRYARDLNAPLPAKLIRDFEK